jgi:hypothetical protein
MTAAAAAASGDTLRVKGNRLEVTTSFREAIPRVAKVATTFANVTTSPAAFLTD